MTATCRQGVVIHLVIVLSFRRTPHQTFPAGNLRDRREPVQHRVLVLTKRGQVRLDKLTIFDEVASCEENNPLGKIEFKRVEEILVTTARIWHVRVKGKVIRTTREHRFYVWGKDGFRPGLW